MAQRRECVRSFATLAAIVTALAFLSTRARRCSGRRPMVAVGNTNGDIPMLRFVRSLSRPALRLLLLHDDQEREFDYTAGAEQALERAQTQGWTVVSIKHDWSTVFAPAAAAGAG